MLMSELDQLVVMHQAEIFRYLRYLGAERATAEDLVQETFLAAYESANVPADDPDARGRRAAWLRGIARNKLRMHVRHDNANPARANSELVEQSFQAAETIWQHEFLRGGDGFDYLEAMRKCLTQLPPFGRQALEMFYAQGKSHFDIAATMRISSDAVKARMQRLRAKIAECVRLRLNPTSGD